MSQFVNYKKHRVALPLGCKNLIDVVRHEQQKLYPLFWDRALQATVTRHEAVTGTLSEVGKYMAMVFESCGLMFTLRMSTPDELRTVSVARMEGSIIQARVVVQRNPDQQRVVRYFFARRGLLAPGFWLRKRSMNTTVTPPKISGCTPITRRADSKSAPRTRRLTGARGTAVGLLLGLVCSAHAAGLESPAVRTLEGELRIHDPSTIVRCSSHYWVFGTGWGIRSRVSPDLSRWQAGPPVFSSPPDWTTNTVKGNHGYFWAPDVVQLQGRYLLYYSISTWGSRDSAIGLATASAPAPGSTNLDWQDRGLVLRSTAQDEFNAIDPSALLDASGRLWLAFGSYWSGIKLVELDPATGLRLAVDSPIYSLAWNESIEAACLYQHGDFFYLFVNWGQCCRGTNSTYQIRVGRSPAATGPFLDRAGTDLMQRGGSLLLGTDGPRIGPGHAGILKAGDSYWLSYHYYDANEHGISKLGLVPLNWSADGWPGLAASRHGSGIPK